MKTIRLTDKVKSITIGRQGENRSTLIRIDLSSWLNYFDEIGTFSLWHQRCGEKNKYPVLISQNDGVIDWEVTSTDTAIVGVGKCEIVYCINDVIMKSRVVDTVVEQSITGQETEPPEDFESWFNDILTAADSISGSVEQVMAYSESASESAIAAGEYANIASEAATNIHEYTELAVQSAADAKSYSESASIYAEQSSENMDEAIAASASAQESASNAASSEAAATLASIETKEKAERMQQFFEDDVIEYLDNTLQDTKTYTDNIFSTIRDVLSLFNEDIADLIKTEPALNDVNFFDYDGKLVASYTLIEVSELTELPTPPKHDGLEFSGWNHTLEDVQALTHKEDVGAIYNTEDGWTHLKIHIRGKSRSTITLYFSQTVANGVAVDWGDGSNISTVDSTGNVTLSHSYSKLGYYTIKMRASEGCTLGFGHKSAQYSIFGASATNASGARAYLDCLTEVNIGSGVTDISSYAFQDCPSLGKVTIPNGVTVINENAFEYCYSLETIILPLNPIEIGWFAFQYCNGLKNVISGSGNVTVGTYAFLYCYNLNRISLSDNSLLGSNAFNRCESLQYFRVPEDITTLEDRLFANCVSLNEIVLPDSLQTIGNSTFLNCYSLATVSIPEIRQISASAFSGCYGIGEVHLANTTPPTLSNINAFSNNASDRMFYVPNGSSSVYKVYSNWSTYSSYIKEEQDLDAGNTGTGRMMMSRPSLSMGFNIDTDDASDTASIDENFIDPFEE